MNASRNNPEVATGTQVGDKYDTCWGWMISHPGEVVASSPREAMETFLKTSPWGGDLKGITLPDVGPPDQEGWYSWQHLFGDPSSGEEGVDWAPISFRVRRGDELFYGESAEQAFCLFCGYAGCLGHTRAEIEAKK